MPTHTPIMPDESPREDRQPQNNLATATIRFIDDNIEDGRTLRHWRPKLALIILIGCGVFYSFLLTFLVCLFVFSECLSAYSPMVLITVIIILAIITALMFVTVAKAVFGRGVNKDATYTPLQTFFHLMKETQNC